MKYLIGLLCVIILSSSCQRIISNAIGIEMLTEFDQEKVDAFYEGFNLTGLSVDKKGIGIEYYELLKQQEQFDTLEKKNLAQPIQFYTMDKEKMIHRMYNCLAPFSLKGLKWNASGCYSNFPPQCSLEDYEEQFEFLNQRFIKKDIDRKYRVVFIWTNFMTSQSQSALTTLLEGIDHSNTRAETHITFVNTDKFFSQAEYKNE